MSGHMNALRLVSDSDYALAESLSAMALHSQHRNPLGISMKICHAKDGVWL